MKKVVKKTIKVVKHKKQQEPSTILVAIFVLSLMLLAATVILTQ